MTSIQMAYNDSYIELLTIAQNKPSSCKSANFLLFVWSTTIYDER